MLRTIIIEDELDAQNLLSKIINEYCPDLKLIGIAGDIEESRKLIESEFPDLVFFDIEIGGGNSFDLLTKLKNRKFKVVFTTAYEEYALRAFKFDAIDYILKPYSPKDVISAVGKVKQRTYDESIFNRLDFLVKQTQQSTNGKISVPTSEGLHIFNVSDIMRLEADRAYCHIYLSDSTKVMLSKPLKDIEDQLPKDIFFRSHASHLLNTNYVEKYLNKDGGYALMTDGSQVPVARRRKQEFLDFLS